MCQHYYLGSGFKYFFSPLLGKMIQIDVHMFSKGLRLPGRYSLYSGICLLYHENPTSIDQLLFRFAPWNSFKGHFFKDWLPCPIRNRGLPAGEMSLTALLVGG